MESAIDAYFTELAKTWADNDYLTVRISQIETRLLNVEGIVDAQSTTLNGSASNLQLDPDVIPVRGSISVS